ncbi:MAG: hydrogenase maturation protease [Bacteroidales bacterium]|nr:hydrogenase maturation protease [Bacteroidales bacterium]
MKVEEKDILILGLGNEILMDDGIGPRLCAEVQKRFSEPNIKYETAAIGGLELLELIQGYNTLIIIDAIKTKDGKPGDVYYLTPSSFKETSNISNIHDISFLTALKLGEKLKIKIPSKIHIIAIEIVEDLIFGTSFTPAIQKKYNSIKTEVIKLIGSFLS